LELLLSYNGHNYQKLKEMIEAQTELKCECDLKEFLKTLTVPTNLISSQAFWSRKLKQLNKNFIL